MGGKLRAMVAAGAAASVLGMAMATPAHAAATGYDRCPDGAYCMFSGLDGGGDIVVFRSNAPDLSEQGIDNLGKSDWNRTASTVYLFSEHDYGGCAAITGAGSQGNFYSSFRDFFSSVQFGGSGWPACQA